MSANINVNVLENNDLSGFSSEFENKEVSIAVREKTNVSQEFVLMFVENVQNVVHDLSKTEFKVLLSIVKFSQYKNIYNVTQLKIAEDSSLTQQQVSRSMIKLKEKSFLISQNGLDYVNPYLFIKGGITQLKKDKEGALSAVRQLNLFSSSIVKSF